VVVAVIAAASRRRGGIILRAVLMATWWFESISFLLIHPYQLMEDSRRVLRIVYVARRKIVYATINVDILEMNLAWK
jgi:hypothetical protein